MVNKVDHSAATQSDVAVRACMETKPELKGGFNRNTMNQSPAGSVTGNSLKTDSQQQLCKVKVC